MTIGLRRAESGDVAAIADIHTLARREAMPYLPELHTDVETRDWLMHVVLPQQEVWVAERAGRVVGVSALEGQVLEQLYVLPGERGRGVGSSLLAKALEIAGGEVMLWTFQRNTAARTFYEHRGFVAIECTDGAGNEEREPDVRYRWSRGEQG